MLENRPGSLAELCTELAKVAVNIQAVQASEGKPIVSVRLLVSHWDTAKKVCERMGLNQCKARPRSQDDFPTSPRVVSQPPQEPPSDEIQLCSEFIPPIDSLH